MSDTVSHDSSAAAVVTRDLTVERGGRTLLDRITCAIPRGKCSAILGRNGCGKTTFTRALTGSTFVTSGSAVVLGETIGQTDIRALRRRVAVVNPTSSTADAHRSGAVVDAELSAREAVLTGYFGTIGLYDTPTAAQREHADHLLTQVGLAAHREQRFFTLSTGEQRRCLIARALVHLPQLLILDEPTAGLDVAGREQVLAVVERILARPDPPTVLMITHHVEELSPRTAQVMLMKDGRFTRIGPPREVVTPETLTDTFGCKVYVRQIHGRHWLEVLPEAWLDWV
jgi:iron complex transport system ATP-binding protein